MNPYEGLARAEALKRQEEAFNAEADEQSGWSQAGEIAQMMASGLVGAGVGTAGAIEDLWKGRGVKEANKTFREAGEKLTMIPKGKGTLRTLEKAAPVLEVLDYPGKGIAWAGEKLSGDPEVGQFGKNLWDVGALPAMAGAVPRTARALAKVPGQIAGDFEAASVRGLPGFGVPATGKSQWALLGERLPSGMDESFEEMLARTGYRVGSGPLETTTIQVDPVRLKTKPSLTPEENAAYKANVDAARALPPDQAAIALTKLREARKAALGYKVEHHGDNWEMPTVSGFAKVDEDTGITTYGPRWKEDPTKYHRDIKTKDVLVGVERAKAIDDASTAMVNEVRGMVEDAAKGDANAATAIDAVRWYGDTQKLIKDLFGVDANLYGRLQGSQSPNTKLRQQHIYAQEIYNRWKGGEFDDALAKFQVHMEKKPEGVSANAWAKKLNKKGDPLFDPSAVISRENGMNYGINTINGMLALTDRISKAGPGDLPKMRNFIGNMIGESFDPTIDIWAHRSVGRLMGFKRGSPETNAKVPGAHREEKAATLTAVDRKELHRVEAEFGEQSPEYALKVSQLWAKRNFDATTAPDIDRQYGVGADVFRVAARKLGMSPADLQAIMWVKEKGLWDNHGWNKTDDGEANLPKMIRQDNPR